jgi:outer membrane lipoprotein SlyB
LVGRVGECGLLGLERLIPVLGGILGAGLDDGSTRRLGAFASAALAGGAGDSAARARTSRDQAVEVIDVELIDVELIDVRIIE